MTSIPIQKQIPPVGVPFVTQQSNQFGDTQYVINPVWYTFLYNFATSALTTTGSGFLSNNGTSINGRTLVADASNTIIIVNGSGFTGNPTFGVNISNLPISGFPGIVGINQGGTGSSTVSGAQTNLQVPSISGTGATGTWPISITGNANTVTTNANLTGMVTSSGNTTTVVTNANLTGDVTSVGNATTVVNTNITGDATTTGTALTLATVNANVGTFGSSSNIPIITVNAKGLITAASNTSISGLPGRLLNIQAFTSSGTYTPSAGVNNAYVECWGGGASGGSNTTTSVAGGGGAGAYASGYTAISGTVTVTIGAGGLSVVANSNTAGNAGGDTSFGSAVIAKGGSGGTGSGGGQGGAGGAAASCTGTKKISGGRGSMSNSTIALSGGTSPGNTPMNPERNTLTVTGLANSGQGGSGGNSGNASGAGGSGYCVVFEYS